MYLNTNTYNSQTLVKNSLGEAFLCRIQTKKRQFPCLPMGTSLIFTLSESKYCFERVTTLCEECLTSNNPWQVQVSLPCVGVGRPSLLKHGAVLPCSPMVGSQQQLLMEFCSFGVLTQGNFPVLASSTLH